MPVFPQRFAPEASGVAIQHDSVIASREPQINPLITLGFLGKLWQSVPLSRLNFILDLPHWGNRIEATAPPGLPSGTAMETTRLNPVIGKQLKKMAVRKALGHKSPFKVRFPRGGSRLNERDVRLLKTRALSQGVLDGLRSPAYFIGGYRIKLPRVHRSLGDDWRAVGADLSFGIDEVSPSK